MFKKIDFKGLNYKDLDRYNQHDLKRDELHKFYLTFDFLDLIKKWPEIVGQKLAPHTSPLRISQDALYVVTKHSIYSQELSFLGETIKNEIFRVFPNLKPIVKRIMFQTKESFFEVKEAQSKLIENRPKLHPQSPQYKLLKQEAEKIFEHIENPELKSILVSIFIQSKNIQKD